MNTDERDPLETKLRRMRPRPMSADLRGRIAERISQSARARARLVRGSLGALAAVFLVSATVVVALRGPRPGRNGATAVVGPALPAGEYGRSGERPAERERPAEPALRLVHRLSGAESPEEIDAILDQYAPRWLVFTQTNQEHLLDVDGYRPSYKQFNMQ